MSRSGWKWAVRPIWDLFPAAVAAALVYLFAPIMDPTALRELGAAGATVMGLLAAVVTFARTGVYGSHSEAVERMRVERGDQMRRVWLRTLQVTILAAMACLGVIALAAFGQVRVALTMFVVAALLGLLAALRSVSWLKAVWIAEDKALSVIKAPRPLRQAN